VFTLWLLHGKRKSFDKINASLEKINLFRNFYFNPLKLDNLRGTILDFNWLECSCSCVTDPKCTILIIVWQRKKWNDKLQNSCRSNSAGSKMKWYFTVTLRKFCRLFEYTCHFIFCLEKLLHLVANFVRKWQLTSVWQIFSKILKSHFICEVMHKFFTGVSVNCCLQESFAIKILGVTSLNFSQKKL